MEKSTRFILFILFLPTLLVGMTTLILMTWRIPSHVQVELTVNRVVFNISGNESKRILTPIQVRSVTAEKFEHLEIHPERLEMANPAQYLIEQDRYPESAWTLLAFSSPIVISGKSKELQPAVTIERDSPTLSTVGTLDGLWGRPGARVTLETNESSYPNLTIRVDEQQSNAVLTMQKRFLLISIQGQLSGINQIPYEADSLTFRVRLPSHHSSVEITGQPHSLILAVVGSKDTNFFSMEELPIRSIDFTHQEGIGGPQTSLIGEGTITYPDYSQIKTVRFKAPDSVDLDYLDKFSITQMSLDPMAKGIRLKLRGVAGLLKTGSRKFPTDHRLTYLDTFWQSQKLSVLVIIISWVITTTVGMYKLYKEIVQVRRLSQNDSSQM
ncbi:MAG: hypothetical protein A2X82_02695 [Geobacteraceae bacterium GWC2_55_20]|nr:MAG: hypothetical protein A2X82_02695 [Geobacteraceae bacterium GWC2_55_20]HBA72078.1 hypothetical protein [Geobacter sp.]